MGTLSESKLRIISCSWRGEEVTEFSVMELFALASFMDKKYGCQSQYAQSANKALNEVEQHKKDDEKCK